MPISAKQQRPSPDVLGSTTARLFTPPAVTRRKPGPCGCGCALTPITSLGFVVYEFSVELGRPLDPWQRWLVIHAMETRPDGSPRFRQVLVLVARQNGKTELLVVLSLFWLFVQMTPLILGTSTKLDYAKESWEKAIGLAKRHDDFRQLISQRGAIRRANGEQELTTVDSCRYKIAASNEEGGRSLTVHRLVEDELRQHHDWSAHEAAENAMNAVWDGQAWAISNAGDVRSVVLNSLRASALAFIDTGEGDDRLGLFEYSAPDGADVTDVAAIASANPNLGRRIDLGGILGKARRAKDAGGEQEAKFRTEVLCQSVESMEQRPIEAAAWRDLTDKLSTPKRKPVVLAYDVDEDGAAATVAAAGRREDGLIHVELLHRADGTEWLAEFLRTKQQSTGAQVLHLGGAAPAASLVPDLGGLTLVPVASTQYAAACGLLQKIVNERGIRHRGDARIAAALHGAGRRKVGNGAWMYWRGLSTAPLSGLIAPILAVWGLTSLPPEPDYDPLASIG